MANKSVSVKIGADTKDFIKGLKAADKQITATQRTANELQKGLKLEFNEKNFVQAQKQYQKALEQTAEKAQSIRDKLKALEEGGKVNTADYQALELELAKTENRAVSLKENLEKINKINLDNANKAFTNLSNKLETAAKKTAVLSGAAVAAIAGMTKLAKDAVATGDTIQTTADQYNLSAEAIQKWNYIALQSDVPAEQLYKSMTKARDAIGTALVGGTSTAKTALEALIGDLSKVPTDTEGAFNSVITALAGVEDKTMQAYYANEIFGERVATQLIPLLNQGADGLKELGEEFETMGYLSNEQVRKLADFDTEMNKVNTQLQNAKTELGTALLPVYKSLADILQNRIVPAIKSVSSWFDNLSDHTKSMITNILLFTAALSPVLLIASKITGIIPSILKGLNMLSAHPIIAIIGVVAGLMAYLYTTNEQFADSINRLIKPLSTILTSILQPISKVLSLIFEIAQPLIDIIGDRLIRQFEILATVLEPVAWLLEKISDLMNKTWDFIGMIFGKGWLWGKENTNSGSHFARQNQERPTMDFNDYNFELPANTSTNTSYNNYSNDSYNIELNLNASGNLDYDARSLADEVIKQIAVKKQALGR